MAEQVLSGEGGGWLVPVGGGECGDMYVYMS
jgi:hypothetical protein